MNDESDAYRRAIGDVLNVLATGAFDLDAVLDAILRDAAVLCRADRGFIYLLEDGLYRHRVDFGAPAEIVEFNKAHPVAPTRGSVTGRTVIERRPVHVPDVFEDPEYTYWEAQKAGNFRSLLGVPMLHDGVVIGVIDFYRDHPLAFTDTEIELVTQFANQAAVAVELSRQAQTIERQRAQLARFLSPQVSALVSSADAERLLAGHRREITVVFCDLRGFSAFSEAAAPEDVVDVLRAYHEALGTRIGEYGATLERFTGDGLMAFFNDPVEQADHVERAIRMAIAMRSDVGKLAVGWRRHGFELGFGVGIATGYATLGQIGFKDRVDYAAVGSVVNLAARLCAEAGDGTILITERAHAVVEHLIAAQPRDDLVVKGFARPVRVVAVGDASEAA